MLLGGFGFLSRLHGLSVDSLVEAEVVLADGRIVIINEKEYEGELPVRSPVFTCMYSRGKWRPLVGIARQRFGALHRNSLQGASVSRPRRLCGESDIVSRLSSTNISVDP
jgi:hypothetical protein